MVTQKDLKDWWTNLTPSSEKSKDEQNNEFTIFKERFKNLREEDKRLILRYMLFLANIDDVQPDTERDKRQKRLDAFRTMADFFERIFEWDEVITPGCPGP